MLHNRSEHSLIGKALGIIALFGGGIAGLQCFGSRDSRSCTDARDRGKIGNFGSD